MLAIIKFTKGVFVKISLLMTTSSVSLSPDLHSNNILNLISRSGLRLTLDVVIRNDILSKTPFINSISAYLERNYDSNNMLNLIS